MRKVNTKAAHKKALVIAQRAGWGSVEALADHIHEDMDTLYRWAVKRPRVLAAIARGSVGALPNEAPPEGVSWYLKEKTNLGGTNKTVEAIGSRQMTDRTLRTWAEERPRVWHALINGINFV